MVIPNREECLLQTFKKEPYKQVIILRGFNDLSFKEIGNIFEESENWARVTFHRGKQRLREILKKEEEK